tara:strand:+ start:166 stop:2433 length:2268 start_codon:yes stop_codon:yes gene_type:complete
MKVILHNFRYYKGDHEKELEVGVKLIKGRNGKGKTSLLESIDYVLYGKIQKQYSFETKSCYVRLEISDGVWIQRNSGPGKLEFQTGKGLYSGAEAQHLIDQMYGSRDVFLSSSYLKQGERCALMDGTNAEKMALIRSIAFREDDVLETQDKIKAKLKSQVDIVKKLNQELDISKIRLNDFLKENHGIDEFNSKLNLEELGLNLKNLNDKSNQLNVDFQKVISVESQIKTIQSMIENLSGEVDEVKINQECDEIDKQIRELNEKCEKVREYQAQKSVQEKSEQILKNHRDTVSKCETEVMSTQLQTGKFTVEELNTRILEVQGNEKIQEEINMVLAKIGVTTQIDIPKQVGEIGSQIRSLKGKSIECQTDIENKKWNEDHKNIKKCPKCLVGLATKGDELIYVSDNYVQELKPVTDLNANQTKLDSIKTQIDKLEFLKLSINESETKLNDLKSKVKIVSGCSNLKSLSKLRESKIKLVDSQARLNQVEKDVTVFEVKCEVTETIIEINKKISELTSTKSQLKSKIDKKNVMASEEKKLLELKESLGTKSSEDIKCTINELSQKILETKSIIIKCEQKIKYEKFKSNYLINQMEVEKESEKSSKLSKIFEIAKQVEIDVLEESVAHLNHKMKEFLDIMFTEDNMVIEFKTVRETKSKPGSKSMQCSMSIFFKNSTYDKPSQLSGGERERVSIAMMLSLNSLLDSNLIMLDETLGSIDTESRLAIIEMMQNIVDDNKVCVIIEHVPIVGVYEHQMEMI